MIPASRFKRFVAYLIDGLILSIPIALLIALLIPFAPTYDAESVKTIIIKYSGVCSFFIMLFYFVLFESSRYQATPGKMLFNLYVSDNDNHKISFMRALGRYFLWWLPTLPTVLVQITIQSQADYQVKMAHWWWFLVISYVLMIVWVITIFFTKERKTVYDMLSSTRVNAKPISKLFND